MAQFNSYRDEELNLGFYCLAKTPIFQHLFHNTFSDSEILVFEFMKFKLLKRIANSRMNFQFLKKMNSLESERN